MRAPTRVHVQVILESYIIGASGKRIGDRTLLRSSLGAMNWAPTGVLGRNELGPYGSPWAQ